MTSPLDDALKLTAAAVQRYGADKDMIAKAAGSLTGMGATTTTRLYAEVDALGDALLHVADVHAGPHPDCQMCGAIRNGLAVAMGVVRAEVGIEFEGRLTD